MKATHKHVVWGEVELVEGKGKTAVVRMASGELRSVDSAWLAELPKQDAKPSDIGKPA